MSISKTNLNQPFIKPKTFRALPPGGGFASARSIWKAYKLLKTKGKKPLSVELNNELKKTLFPVSSSEEKVHIKVNFTSSGKAALFELLSKLPNTSTGADKIAALSSYTCPDVASALIKAGYELVLFDLKAGTFEPDYESLSLPEGKSLNLLILSNLYGLPDSLPNDELLKKLPIAPNNFYIIDDACQAGLSFSNGKRIGTRGDFGIFSFGRGKFLPGMGGGAFLVKEDSINQRDLNTSKEIIKLSPLEDLIVLAKSQLSWFFQFPAFYKILASIRSLKLGETYYNERIETKELAWSQALIVYSQLLENQERAELYRENSKKWLSLFKDFSNITLPFREFENQQVSPIRFPVLLKPALIKSGKDIRDKLLKNLKEEGLGATASYPGLLEDYPEISDKIIEKSSINSRDVANQIITLPIHRFLRDKDFDRTKEIFNKYI